MSKTHNAGIVTAYGAAVRGGYTGTYEEFCAQQAQYAENARQMEQAVSDVRQIKSSVESAVSEAETYASNANQSAVNASNSATQASEFASNASQSAESASQFANNASNSANSAGQSATSARTSATNASASEQSAHQSVEDAQDILESVQTEGDTQIGRVQAKGDEVLNSIPEDYTEVQKEISEINGSLEKLNNDLDVNISVNPGFEQGFWWGKSSSTTPQDYVRTISGIPCVEGDIFTVDMSDHVGTEVQFNFYLQDAFVSRTTIRQSGFVDSRASAVTPADVDNVRINIYSGGSSIHIDPISYSDLQIFKNWHRSLKETVDGFYVDIPIPFEVGIISIGAEGWTYPNENTTKRLRTIMYETVRLYAGDIVKVVPNKSIRVFLGCRKDDGTYSSVNWQTRDYTITIGGEYVMSVAYNPDKDITDFGELASGVYIRRDYGKYLFDLQMQKVSMACTHASLNSAKRNVRSINHRGWYTAPENTITAFKMSKYYGYDCVETDIRATSDGVFVLLHDATINRIARNSDGATIENAVNIADITLETALTYDFGAYKGTQYAGTKICTLEELLDFCKWTSVEPYLEVKNTLTNEQIHQVVDTVADYGMLKNVTFFGDAYVADIISQYNHDVRVGIVLFSNVTQSSIDSALSFRERGNPVFIDAQVDLITAEGVELAKNAEVPLEVWNANASTFRNNPDPYISGFTTDNVTASAYTVWYKRYRFNGMG